MEEATHAAIFLVAAECAWRLTHCDVIQSIFSSRFHPGLIFILSYLGCIGNIFLDIKNAAFFQSDFIRGLIKTLHACDGILALVIGIGIYLQNDIITLIGILGITKLYMLYLLSRMVTGVKSYSKLEMVVQTTKTFIHHTASFYFLADPTTAAITAFWRFISMNGHAALTLREKMSEEGYTSLMWMITHARNAAMMLVLVLCWWSPSIRRGFGKLCPILWVI
jgi:hypothetical protein